MAQVESIQATPGISPGAFRDEKVQGHPKLSGGGLPVTEDGPRTAELERERERERERGGWREREKAVPMTVLILGSKILLKLH